ncbi:MAG: cytochrome c553 [Kiritimatiellia bacterium]|jgi:cytochrome c553
MLGLVSCETASPSQAGGPSTQVRFESCLVCHSTREMQRGPILNGLQGWYAEAQMKKFRSGVRGQKPENLSEHLMGTTGIQHLASDREIKAMAKLIDRLKPVEHLKSVRGDAANGQLVYNRCTACHGKKAEGKRLLKAPRLSHLEDWYVLDQMRKFANGQRGYHEKDANGQVMAASSAGLTDQELKDVTVYISEL